MSRQKIEEHWQLPNDFTKQTSTKIKGRLNIGSTEPTGIWIDNFISKYVELEVYLSQCYILDPSGSIKVRKPSKFISSALEAQKFDTMINRVIVGLTKILAFGNRIVLRSDYENEKKHRDRLKRIAKSKRTEMKVTEKKKIVKDKIIRFRTTFLFLFLELVIIVLSFFFNDIIWVRILLYTLIPVFLILVVIGFFLEKKRRTNDKE